MVEAVATREAIRRLADQLVVEYAGAVAPGKVIRIVHSTASSLLRTPLRGPSFIDVLEHSVRSTLVRECRVQAVDTGAGNSRDRASVR